MVEGMPELYLTHLSRIEDKLDDLQRGLTDLRLELAKDYVTKAEYQADKEALRKAQDKKATKKAAGAAAGGGILATLAASIIEVLGR